jgi:hypothetical protein
MTQDALAGFGADFIVSLQRLKRATIRVALLRDGKGSPPRTAATRQAVAELQRAAKDFGARVDVTLQAPRGSHLRGASREFLSLLLEATSVLDQVRGHLQDHQDSIPG